VNSKLRYARTHPSHGAQIVIIYKFPLRLAKRMNILLETMKREVWKQVKNESRLVLKIEGRLEKGPEKNYNNSH
jgi:hypothetical protein